MIRFICCDTLGHVLLDVVVVERVVVVVKACRSEEIFCVDGLWRLRTPQSIGASVLAG